MSTSKALCLAITLALPTVAYASGGSSSPSKTEMMLRPGTRSMSAMFSVAPALALDSGLHTQVKLGQGFAWHPSGDSSGLAFGGEIQESLGSSAFMLTMGPKVWYDIQISDALGIYLAPSVLVGFGYVSGGGTSTFGFDMQMGFEAKMLIQDRGMIFFRPITLDIAVADRAAVRWDLVFGGGVTF
jgi:hypothetical protein